MARRRRRLVWINMGGRVGNKCQVGLTVLPRNITRFTNANFDSWRRWIIVSRMARLFVIILEHFPFFRVSFFCHCTRATVKSVGIFRNNEPSDEPSRSDVFPIPQFFDYSLLAKTNRLSPIHWNTINRNYQPRWIQWLLYNFYFYYYPRCFEIYILRLSLNLPPNFYSKEE